MQLTSRFAICGGALLLSACGATGGGNGSAQVPVLVPLPNTGSAQSGTANGGMTGMTMMVGNTGQKLALAATRDAIWAKLPDAYESLGLPLSFKDDARFRLGNGLIKARRQLNGVQMRSIVDCGSDLNGEKAESYDIKLSVETSLLAVGETTEITTVVSGLGRSPSVGTSDVSCGTKGEIERRIIRYLRVQLVIPGK